MGETITLPVCPQKPQLPGREVNFTLESESEIKTKK